MRPGISVAAGTVATLLADSARHRQAWPAAALFSRGFRNEHPDRVSEYMPYFARHRAPPWMTGWQALAAACFGRRGSLARVRASTLVLHGGQDVMVPLANAELLADGIPGAELHVLSDAGHAVPLEHPEVSARLLVDWVQRHADVDRTAPRRREVVGERLARPFTLLSGTVRNTGEAAALAVGAVRGMIRRTQE